MAHSLSAKKRVRQNAKRRLRNRSKRSVLKSQTRSCSEAISTGDAATAETRFREVCKRLDREANHGLIHRNAAARKKSRLAKRVNALKQKAGS